MPELRSKKAPLPPRWFIRLFWTIHRGVYRATRGRFGLWRPKPGGWGAMCLRTIGRRTGRVHPVVVGYFEDGPNLVTMAMNGWGSTEPAWWLNLQAHPDVTVDLVDGPRQVTGRAAHGDERARLWARWQQIDKNLDAYAARRPVETPVVVFEPRSSRRADGSASGLTRRAEDGPGPEDPVEGVRPAVPAASFEAGAFKAGTVKRP